jgi:hypothetical protein
MVELSGYIEAFFLLEKARYKQKATHYNLIKKDEYFTQGMNYKQHR